MPARKKVTPEIEAYVRERRTRGKSHATIAAELKAQGTPISVFTVHSIAPLRKKQGKQVKRKALPAVAAADAAEELPPAAALEGASLEQLERIVVDLERRRAAADEAGDGALYVSISRLLLEAVKQRERMRPPAPPDPTASPDMQAAMKRGRELFHKLLTDMLAEPAA